MESVAVPLRGGETAHQETVTSNWKVPEFPVGTPVMIPFWPRVNPGGILDLLSCAEGPLVSAIAAGGREHRLVLHLGVALREASRA